MMSRTARRAVKTVVFLLCLAPALKLGWDTLAGGLGANPVEALTHRTGWWALALLTVTLAVTPARRLTGWNELIKFRRMLGLFAFFYATLHFLIYLGLDRYLAWDTILEDVGKRPYITVGFTTFLLLLSLALTSTNGWIRRLGKRWQRLHALIYVAALGGVIHFLWLVKADIREPATFGLVIVILLAARLARRRARRAASAARRPVAESSMPAEAAS